MTVANGVKSEAGGTGAIARRCARNVGAALAVLFKPARLHPRQPWQPAWRQLAIAAVVVVAVFLLAMFFVDAKVTNTVAPNMPRWLISAFDWFTDFGKSAWFLWPLGILFLALAALPQNLSRVSQAVLAAIMVRVGFLFVAIGLPSLFASIVKNMIGRARPGVGGSVNPSLFDPFHWAPAYASMPSGHATTAFAVLAAFGVLWPRARTVLLIYALLIAFSRIVVNAHYLSDVAAGALVGIIGVLLVRRYFALRLLAFSVTPDGVLHQFPGPSPRRIKSVARELLAE